MNGNDTWTIPGAGGEAILGNTHTPERDPAGVVIIVHGLLGYKDYGMFPALGGAFARAGWTCHRINLSHSGMTDAIEMFARPDLFERDTWNRQRTDVQAVIEAIGAGRIAGAGLPLVLVGHSRGGVTAIRAAAERFEHGLAPAPAGVITVAAPDTCCSLGEADRAKMLEQGYLEVKSSRTGQTLRLGRGWLQEQLDDPAGHDVPRAARQVACPMLIAHGADDPTVDPAAARRLAAAGPRARLLMIEGGDHVMNTPNPFDPEAPMSRQLGALVEGCAGFLRDIVA
jgi:pimeloyl-ACP methyl ester carboxylesterase